MAVNQERQCAKKLPWRLKLVAKIIEACIGYGNTGLVWVWYVGMSIERKYGQ